MILKKNIKNKRTNKLPIHILIYMTGSSMVCTIAIILLLIRFVLNIYTIDPYYLICALIISVALFLTAAVAIKDWKS